MKTSNTPINIALDIETLSTRPTAAIIAIAAQVFSFTDKSTVFCDSATKFTALVNPASCAMKGLHFDMDTIQWWSRQSSEAKSPYEQTTGQDISIVKALASLNRWLNDIRSASPSGKILIWTQGTDFDIAILRYAFAHVLGYETPWHHDEVRDARTFIHATLGLIHPEVENPYALIPKNPSWKPHQPLSDVHNLIWNVRQVALITQKALLTP